MKGNSIRPYIPYPIEFSPANFRNVAKSTFVKRLGRKNEIRKMTPEVINNILFVVVNLAKTVSHSYLHILCFVRFIYGNIERR